MDNGAKAAIIGLTLEHTPEDVYKALMEGNGYELAYILEKFALVGISANEIRASGGGAKSKIQLQIKSDILGKPLIPMVAKDATVAGCGMIAGTATGIYDSYQQASEYFVHFGTPIDPDPLRHSQYRDLYEKYKELREQMLGFWR